MVFLVSGENSHTKDGEVYRRSHSSLLSGKIEGSQTHVVKDHMLDITRNLNCTQDRYHSAVESETASRLFSNSDSNIKRSVLKEVSLILSSYNRKL